MSKLSFNGFFLQNEVKNGQIDLVGVVTKSNVSITVFAGNGFDVNVSQTMFYIALDYQKKPFQLNPHFDRVVAEVAGILADNDCQQVNLTLTKWSS